MYSMTGYGVASGRVKKLNIKVQIRSVNHRFFNLQLNLPETLSEYEDEIKQLVQAHIRRGSVNLSLKIDEPSSQPILDFNIKLLKKYLQKLKTVFRVVNFNYELDLDLATLINLPGVMEPSDTHRKFSKEAVSRIKEIIRKALFKLIQMRQREGNHLKQKLKQLIYQMQILIEKIKNHYPKMLANYQAKLRTRIKELVMKQELSLSDNLEQKIAEEVVVVTQRSDITEELHRLDSHLKEFIRSMEQDQEVGKKLDFLTQECLREINAISSKANDAQIARWVVGLKLNVEKLKEQVQNIE